jgi:hypothetical protein
LQGQSLYQTRCNKHQCICNLGLGYAVKIGKSTFAHSGQAVWPFFTHLIPTFLPLCV